MSPTVYLVSFRTDYHTLQGVKSATREVGVLHECIGMNTYLYIYMYRVWFWALVNIEQTVLTFTVYPDHFRILIGKMEKEVCFGEVQRPFWKQAHIA